MGFKYWRKRNNVKVKVDWKYSDYKKANPTIDINDFNIKSLMELIIKILKRTYTDGNQIPNYYVSLFPKEEMINTYKWFSGESKRGFWEDGVYYDFYYQYKTEEEERECKKYYLKEEEIHRKENYNRRVLGDRKRNISFDIWDGLIEGKWVLDMEIFKYHTTKRSDMLDSISYKDIILKETKTYNTIFDMYESIMYICSKWDNKVFSEVFIEEIKKLSIKYGWDINSETFESFYNDIFLRQIKSMGEDYCKFWLRKRDEGYEKEEIVGWINKNWEKIS